MSQDPNWSDKIDQEKSLYQVYRRSAVVAVPPFNKQVIYLTIFMCVMYCLANALLGVDNERLTSAITRLSGSMISVTTAILGFLIAGFSIFISLTPKETLIILSKTRYKETDISHFKEIMFNFLNVFTIYLVVLALALVVNTACPLGWSPAVVFTVPLLIVTIFNSIVLSILIVATVYSVLRLKSFIWTMYQGLLMNLML